jgi:hypothetical protein
MSVPVWRNCPVALATVGKGEMLSLMTDAAVDAAVDAVAARQGVHVIDMTVPVPDIGTVVPLVKREKRQRRGSLHEIGATTTTTTAPSANDDAGDVPMSQADEVEVVGEDCGQVRCTTHATRMAWRVCCLVSLPPCAH